MSDAPIAAPTFDPARLDAAWDRYVALVSERLPDFPKRLAPGASLESLAAVEARVETPFSPDLRRLLSRADGSIDEADVFPCWSLYSADQLLEAWEIWRELHGEDYMRYEEPDPHAGAVKRGEHYRLGWLPFAGDGAGDLLCVDMDPGALGVPGQVIHMIHDDDARAVLAPSLTAFLERLTTGFDREILIYDDEWTYFLGPGAGPSDGS